MVGGLEAILNRAALEFDLASARAFFGGRSVLVTGGGGSIGAELCDRLARLGCRKIAVLDHFDHALLSVCEQLRERYPALDVVEVLCDVRDAERVSRWLERVRPDIVVNAAALKHVHLGERHPAECVSTNLIGMRNVLHASADCGADAFVQISTDKAAAPVCVMGASKRLAELHLWGFARERANAPTLKTVRFGNVLESQGSVIPRFRRRIEEGRPLEVTHPEMRRYFMALSEAVQLVIQASALNHESAPDVSGYFLDMGEPVRILDLARDMLANAGAKTDILITGLREGEKLGETLFDEHEIVAPAGVECCYRLSPNSPHAALSSAEIEELEAYIRVQDGPPVAQRLFRMLDERLGRREAVAG